MAEIDERLQRLLGALERGGASGLVVSVRSRIEDADGISTDAEEERDPFARPKEEDRDARRRRHLAIANNVVENVLSREIDLVQAIDSQLRVLRRRSRETDRGFMVDEVVIVHGNEREEASFAVIDARRAKAVDDLLKAWRQALDVMEGEKDS